VSLKKLDQSEFRRVLGEDVPEFATGPLGRLRLVRQLRMTFGQGYRQIPSAKKLLAIHAEETEHDREILRISGKARD